jgi:hypothetical protein
MQTFVHHHKGIARGLVGLMALARPYQPPSNTLTMPEKALSCRQLVRAFFTLFYTSFTCHIEVFILVYLTLWIVFTGNT